MYVEYSHPPIPAGYQQLTVTSAAGGLTVPTDARYAIIKVASGSGRYRDDGTNPTSQSGYPVTTDDEIKLISADQLADFKAILTTDLEDYATFEILYYKIIS